MWDSVVSVLQVREKYPRNIYLRYFSNDVPTRSCGSGSVKRTPIIKQLIIETTTRNCREIYTSTGVTDARGVFSLARFARKQVLLLLLSFVCFWLRTPKVIATSSRVAVTRDKVHDGRLFFGRYLHRRTSCLRPLSGLTGPYRLISWGFIFIFSPRPRYAKCMQ